MNLCGGCEDVDEDDATYMSDTKDTEEKEAPLVKKGEAVDINFQDLKPNTIEAKIGALKNLNPELKKVFDEYMKEVPKFAKKIKDRECEELYENLVNSIKDQATNSSDEVKSKLGFDNKKFKYIEYQDNSWYFGQTSDGMIINNDLPKGFGYFHQTMEGKGPGGTNLSRLSVGVFNEEYRLPIGRAFILYNTGGWYFGATNKSRLFAGILAEKMSENMLYPYRIYEGRFLFDKLNGSQSKIWLYLDLKHNDYCYYEGNVKGSLPHGEGKLTIFEGSQKTVLEGEFKEGNAHGSISYYGKTNEGITVTYLTYWIDGHLQTNDDKAAQKLVFNEFILTP